MWAEDGVDTKPYASGMFPEKVFGKKDIRESWSGIFMVFESVSFPIHEFIVDEENRIVVVRLDGEGLMKYGNLYQNTYIFLFHFDQNNKIKECYEYFNPYIAGENFGVLDKLKY
jgi:ketosteroid isomerase-like protein